MINIIQKVFCTIILIGFISFVGEQINTLANITTTIKTESTDTIHIEIQSEQASSSISKPPHILLAINKISTSFLFPIQLIRGKTLFDGWWIWAYGIGVICSLLLFTDIRRRFTKSWIILLWIIGFIVIPLIALPAYFQFRPTGDLWQCQSCGKKKLIHLSPCPFCSARDV
jgi:hypothetical protein